MQTVLGQLCTLIDDYRTHRGCGGPIGLAPVQQAQRAAQLRYVTFPGYRADREIAFFAFVAAHTKYSSKFTYRSGPVS